MTKLKTRTNQPVNDSDGLLDHLSQNGNKTIVGGNLEVNDTISSNGGVILQPYKETFVLGTDFTYNNEYYEFTSSAKAKIDYLLKNFAVIGIRVLNEIYNVTPTSLLLFNEEAYNENVVDYYISFISLLEDKFTIPKVCQSVLHYWTGLSGGASFEMRVKDNYDNAEGTDSVEDISKIELYGLIRV